MSQLSKVSQGVEKRLSSGGSQECESTNEFKTPSKQADGHMYSRLLKTPNTFFSPGTGKMNTHNNKENNGTVNQVKKLPLSKMVKQKKSQVKDDDGDEVEDIDLSVLNINLNSGEDYKFNIDNSMGSASGKNGHVFFISNNQNCHYAVKRQYISSPKNKSDQSYREQIILDKLRQMSLENKSCNFIEMVKWYKAAPASTSRGDTETTHTKDGHHQLKNNQYMHFILEYAKFKSLSDYKQDYGFSLSRLKSLLFQVIYAISIAQKELEFNHNDLHAGNILLQAFPTDKKYIVYQDWFYKDEDSQEKIYKHWVVSDFIVKISDFGLSRIRMPDSNNIIYNHKNPNSKNFNPSVDLASFVKSLSSLKINDINDPVNAKDKKLLSNLKKKLQMTFAYTMLNHPFFSSLTNAPVDLTPQNSIRISSDGIIPKEFPKPSVPVSVEVPLKSDKTQSTTTTTPVISLNNNTISQNTSTQDEGDVLPITPLKPIILNQHSTPLTPKIALEIQYPKTPKDYTPSKFRNLSGLRRKKSTISTAKLVPPSPQLVKEEIKEIKVEEEEQVEEEEEEIDEEVEEDEIEEEDENEDDEDEEPSNLINAFSELSIKKSEIDSSPSTNAVTVSYTANGRPKPPPKPRAKRVSGLALLNLQSQDILKRMSSR
ncbi:putative protein kinase [Tieghemostelium lacteum]|uniref:Protein kinase domain-containing protein n=1 Tax=Tieghemostelium lacteum TaxID=361077 RepID=A0A152A815_TIELA|nr:putative protein kinase [Tieghemostelium lacteum]|eukprot:KYR02348.1 putative protein kinase [Tieghemostelium lacteum]